MMAGSYKILLVFYLFFLTHFSYSQEVLTGLENNPVAREFYKNYHDLKKSGGQDTLDLPFIDDFSDSYGLPNIELWTDRFAYINNTYAIFPVSAGVATLDALDNTGSLYSNASTFPFQADFLTSKPIDLTGIPSDSVYLSFFYQPGGRGEYPEPEDSLLLDFYTPATARWNKIWAIPGDSTQKNFRRIMIPITDPSYLRKGFRFRFRNYASLFQNDQIADLRANCDHWNIDYVRIDKNRSFTDTVLRDATFIDPMPSLLKDYETVPWSHTEAAHSTQRRPYIQTVIMNHDSISRNIKTSLEIKNLKTGLTTKTPVTSNDISSGDSVLFLFSYDHPFNFGAGDSGMFEVKAILGTDAFDYKKNDTMIYVQSFADYYALDDGSSEAGYGLRGDGTKNSSVAVRYFSFLKDSLRAVDIYFNHTYESLNLNYFFYLNIWSDNNGKPGNLLVNQIGMRPSYSDSLNKFVRYYLDKPIEVVGVFYAGWQKTVDKLENIGFDKNRINNSKNFYNENGEWINSSFPGSLMIRPVLSKKNIVGFEPIITQEQNLLVYPNPADKYIFLSSQTATTGEDMSVCLYDLTGRQIRSINRGDTCIYTGDLKEGIYILRVMNRSEGLSLAVKVIISR
jgi:hypothetical protein